jgi:hypothetical protein
MIQHRKQAETRTEMVDAKVLRIHFQPEGKQNSPMFHRETRSGFQPFITLIAV